MNLNKFARKVTLLEGKKRSVSIAQVKEVLRCAFIEMNKLNDEEIIKTVRRYRGRKI